MFEHQIYLIDSPFFILDILFSINKNWPFMMWYDFLSMESQGCLVIFVAIKSRTFLMCITQWSNTGVFMACLGMRANLADLVSFYIHAVFDHRVYVWKVRVCRVDLKEFVSLYITWRSNTELEHVKILAVDMDDYFDPKIIIFD